MDFSQVSCFNYWNVKQKRDQVNEFLICLGEQQMLFQIGFLLLFHILARSKEQVKAEFWKHIADLYCNLFANILNVIGLFGKK